jgi:2-haloacid dehalogenase
MRMEVRALLFDVFGTVVDWRNSVARELAAAARAKGVTLDAYAMADAWRALYDPQMAPIREGKRPWTRLDTLHRESLVELLPRFGLQGLSAAEIDDLAFAWRRLDPWPDSVPGLLRLKRRYILATCSNGNIALIANMARWGGLPWDAILGAEPTQSYKPQSEAYRGSAEILGLPPGDCMMVAAHNGDLVAASKAGLRTAFVARTKEHGDGQTKDATASGPWDVIVPDFNALASALGC